MAVPVGQWAMGKRPFLTMNDMLWQTRTLNNISSSFVLGAFISIRRIIIAPHWVGTEAAAILAHPEVSLLRHNYGNRIQLIALEWLWNPNFYTYKWTGLHPEERDETRERQELSLLQILSNCKLPPTSSSALAKLSNPVDGNPRKFMPAKRAREFVSFRMGNSSKGECFPIMLIMSSPE